MDVDRLRGMPTGPWRRIDTVTETGSTNADLLARAAAGEDIDGVVLIAESQTAGRGRHGRTWSTPPGSQIALSAGVGVGDVPSDAWGWLPLLTGVAVVDAVAEIAGVTAGLKWPNDVLVGSKKLAGILAEVAAPKPVVVVGLGLNVTEAPDPAATSLSMLGATVDRQTLADAILSHLGTRIAAWKAAGAPTPTLAADYRARSVTIGNRVRAMLPGDRTIEGVASDIDDAGPVAHRHRRRGGDGVRRRYHAFAPCHAIEFPVVGYPDNVLAADEQVVLHRHPHWKRLIGPVLLLIISTAVAAFLAAVVDKQNWGTAKTVVLVVILAVWLLIVGWLTLWPFLTWLTTHFVITDRRVMFRHGLLTRQGIDIPLARINSVEFRHGLIDRMVRTGTLIIESASQDPLEFDDIPQVERVHSLLYHEVFDTLGGEESDSRSSGRR